MAVSDIASSLPDLHFLVCRLPTSALFNDCVMPAAATSIARCWSEHTSSIFHHHPNSKSHPHKAFYSNTCQTMSLQDLKTAPEWQVRAVLIALCDDEKILKKASGYLTSLDSWDPTTKICVQCGAAFDPNIRARNCCRYHNGKGLGWRTTYQPPLEDRVSFADLVRSFIQASSTRNGHRCMALKYLRSTRNIHSFPSGIVVEVMD